MQAPNVVYWPTTRPGCQYRKCTYVNNRCIRSRNIRTITLTVDGLNECNWDAHKKVGVELLYGSVKMGGQTVGDQTGWRRDVVEQAGTPVEHQENEEDTTPMAIRVGVNICCSYVRSPTPSHSQPFRVLQINWEVYFFKRSLCSLLHIASLWFSMNLQMTIQHQAAPFYFL